LPVACSSLPYINRAEHGSRAGQSSDRAEKFSAFSKHKKKKRREEKSLGFLIAVLRDDGVRWWCEDAGCRCRGKDGCAMGSWLQLAALLGDLSG
jgi:hypothetical protein